jgi:hypothetical protein
VVTIYPVTGNRDLISGAFTGSGSNGYAWSCAITGVNSCDLRFVSTEVGPSYSHNRAYGFPVRCVQYLQ